MMVLGSHPLSFLTRLVHVMAMAFLLGGSLLLWGLYSRNPNGEAGEVGRLLFYAARKFEGFFWLALGLIVLTGVGNLGAFGAGLPGADSLWGGKFSIKMFLVLLLILFSLLRTLLIVGLHAETGGLEMHPLEKKFQVLYAGTAVLLAAILLFAVSLNHA